MSNNDSSSPPAAACSQTTSILTHCKINRRGVVLLRIRAVCIEKHYHSVVPVFPSILMDTLRVTLVGGVAGVAINMDAELWE
jgi:hypothetical protein